MSSITLEEAKARLPEILHDLAPGEAMTITEDDRPLATLTAAEEPRRQPRQSGTLKGSVEYMAADFDQPLDDFQPYSR